MSKLPVFSNTDALQGLDSQRGCSCNLWLLANSPMAAGNLPSHPLGLREGMLVSLQLSAP